MYALCTHLLINFEKERNKEDIAFQPPWVAMQGSDVFSKNQGRCNLRLGFPYQNSGCKISLLGRHSSLTKSVVFSTNALIIMKGAYSKVFAHFFFKDKWVKVFETGSQKPQYKSSK